MCVHQGTGWSLYKAHPGASQGRVPGDTCSVASWSVAPFRWVDTPRRACSAFPSQIPVTSQGTTPGTSPVPNLSAGWEASGMCHKGRDIWERKLGF